MNEQPNTNNPLQVNLRMEDLPVQNLPPLALCGGAVGIYQVARAAKPEATEQGSNVRNAPPTI